MRPYPKLLRLAVLRESEAGKPTCRVAKEFGVSRAWVRRVKQDRREKLKFAAYRKRRPDRHIGSLKQRIKDVLVEEPWLSVEEISRVFGPDVDMKMLIHAREELYINCSVTWHGADGSLPQTDLRDTIIDVTQESNPKLFQSLLKEKIEELINWKSGITVAEITRILDASPSAELIAEVREKIALRRAIAAHRESERAPFKSAQASRREFEAQKAVLLQSLKWPDPMRLVKWGRSR